MSRQVKLCLAIEVVICFFSLQLSPLSAHVSAVRPHTNLRLVHRSKPSSSVKIQKTPQVPLAATPTGLIQSLVTGTVTTYAGSAGVPLPISQTPAVAQSLDAPLSVALDNAGGFYFVSPPQNRVYRVTGNGTLFVIAGTGTAGFSGDGDNAISAQLSNPVGVAVDSAGNVFIADYDNARIRKVTPNGLISTIAGNGSYEGSGDSGPATAAGMGPAAVAFDVAGNLFITDLDNSRIRKVNASGIITTIAGNGNYGFSGDGGPAISAALANPLGLAPDSSGNLFISDYDNGRIRKVTTAGIITTIAGNGSYEYNGDGGPATSAAMGPTGVAVDLTGKVFIADFDNDRIRKVVPAGTVSTVAGTGNGSYSGDGGAATSASLRDPFGVAVDAAGNLFIADTSNNRVREVTGAGVINTVAGSGAAIRSGEDPSSGFSGDGGPAYQAVLSGPAAVTIDRDGNVFIADSNNGRIRKVDTRGIITTVAGNGSFDYNGDDILAISAGLTPSSVAVDNAGNLYIADLANFRIRKVNSAGIISTVAGTGNRGYSGDGGPASSAELFTPLSVVLDPSGNLFISDDKVVRKVDTNGVITRVAGNGAYRYNGDGGPATSAAMAPMGIAVDASGNLFIADYANERIRRVNSAGIISTIVGTGERGANGDGGPATAATLRDPAGVVIDTAGNLFIADVGNSRIRRVTLEGIIETVAGTGQSGFSGDGGPATSAQFAIEIVCMIATDAAGNLFIPDFHNNRVRKITFTQQAQFSMVDRGGVSSVSSGNRPALKVGYASVQPATGSAAPAGLAIFGFRQNNILVSEAGVPASSTITSGRIYAEVNGPINTGLAIANPYSQPVRLSFYFTNENGDFGNGETTIPPNSQIAKFLDQPPFNAPAFSGTFTFNAFPSVAVVALRGLINERGEFLITTLPVAPLNTPSTATIFPHYADGGGWTTQIALVNPLNTVLTGTVQFFDQQGAAATLTVNGQSGSDFAYSLPPHSSQQLQTAGTASSVSSGFARVIPAARTGAPWGLLIFSFRSGGITVSEAGVAGIASGNAFRLYAEVSGPIQTGIAVANMSSAIATITVEASRLDGSSTGLTGTLSIPANGQTAVFLNQVQGFSLLPTPFQGVLRLSSSSPISVTGLRGRYNERNDFLITTTPPVNEATASPVATLYFPHIADSGGYTTQFILFSAQPGSSPSGTVQFFSQTGGALDIRLQ